MKDKIIYRKKLICLAAVFSILLTSSPTQHTKAAENTQASKTVQTFDNTATAYSANG